MALAHYEAAAVDAAGNILTSATITVRSEASGSLASIKSDRAGAVSKSNPFTISSSDNGYFDFYVAGGAYKIDVASGSLTRTLRYVAIGTAAEYDTATSGAAVPLLNTANTWGAVQAFPLGAVGAPSLAFTGDTNTGMWSPAADTLAVSTAGSERLRVTSAGNVGIGTTSPNDPLYVKGSLAGANIPITAEGGGNTTTSIQLLIRNPNDITPGAGNDYENECHIRLWAGTTANHRSYINFADYTGTDKWLTGRNASDTWILYSSVTGHRMRFWNGAGSDYGTDLSSSGAYPVRINVSETGVAHGTGGFEVWSGGTVPTVNMFDVARYNNDTIMISVVNNGAGYAPASLSLTAKQSATRGQGVFLHNSVSQTSWYSGVAYNVAGLKYIIGYASQATLNPVLADTSNALLTITSTGLVGIGTTSPSTTLHINGPARVGTYTVATLPAAGTVGAGSIAYVTDANATTQNSIVAGGGANTVLVFSDGTNWRIT